MGPCMPDSFMTPCPPGLTFPMSLPLLFIQMYFSLSAPLMRTRLPKVSVSTMSLAGGGGGGGERPLSLGAAGPGVCREPLPTSLPSEFGWGGPRGLSS